MIRRCSSLNDSPLFIKVISFFIFITLFLNFVLNIFRPWQILFKNIYKVNVVIQHNYLSVVPVVSMFHVNKCENFFVHHHKKTSTFIVYEKVYAYNKYEKRKKNVNLFSNWFIMKKRLFIYFLCSIIRLDILII